MPVAATSFSAFSVDLVKLYDQGVAFAKSSNPDTATQVAEFEKQVQARTKRKLREDILSQIGPKGVYYVLPPKAKPGGMAGLANMMTLVQVPRFVTLIEIKDAEKFSPLLQELMIALNKEIEAQSEALMPAAPPGDAAKKSADTKKAAPPPVAKFQMILASPLTYSLRLPPPFAAMTNLNLTIALGKKHLAIAAAADAARDALALESKTDGRWKPTTEQAEVLAPLAESADLLSDHGRDQDHPGVARQPAGVTPVAFRHALGSARSGNDVRPVPHARRSHAGRRSEPGPVLVLVFAR